MKKEMFLAARSGKWIIIEDLHQLSSPIASEFIKMLIEEILNSDDTKDEVKVWITFEVKGSSRHNIPIYLLPLFR
jgi:hypothetical protein